jgi:hypothetical protein
MQQSYRMSRLQGFETLETLLKDFPESSDVDAILKGLTPDFK